MEFEVARGLLVSQLDKGKIKALHEMENKLGRLYQGWEIAHYFDLPTMRPTHGWSPVRKARGPITETEQERIRKYYWDNMGDRDIDYFHSMDFKISHEIRSKKFDWRDKDSNEATEVFDEIEQAGSGVAVKETVNVQQELGYGK